MNMAVQGSCVIKAMKNGKSCCNKQVDQSITNKVLFPVENCSKLEANYFSITLELPCYVTLGSNTNKVLN